MSKPTLVVMAAGMGSRYGGLKQIDAVGPNGEIIIDYSIYDAVKSGFGQVVFIVKKDIEQAFRQAIGDRIGRYVDTQYAYQEIDAVPSGYQVPPGRTKPWGTAHAILCCKNIVKTPFAVINADDFYGSTSFMEMRKFLSSLKGKANPSSYAMVGFILENTLTEHGTVSRGVCTVNGDGSLTDIQERTKIQKSENGAQYTENGANWIDLPRDSIVSMNLWGLDTSIFDELEKGFADFLAQNRDQIQKAEYFLPGVINNLLIKKKATVQVLTSKERWYGITYREDKPTVVNAIRSLIEQGVYPEKLWGCRQ
jgi:dTDP-glucose pyrophosphorylase